MCVDQSAQDDLLREELDQSKASSQELYPPPLERLHQRLQQLRSNTTGSGSFAMTETSVIRTCLRELYQYARVDGAHVLELVVKAALASVKDRQLQKVADVYVHFILFTRLPLTSPVNIWCLSISIWIGDDGYSLTCSAM